MNDHIIGRARELAIIRQALDETRAGIGGCHVILGPPGIGKSRILRAAGDYADGRDIAVAAREAFRHDLAAPLVSLAGALLQCSPPTGEFAWLAGSAEADPGNHARIHRLRTSLERYAADNPLLIVLDDAHWLDELSALAVRELVPALASSPVRWLLAGRPGPEGTPGAETLNWLAQYGSSITLGVFGETETKQLCESVIGATVDKTVEALVPGCGGNPLLIEELLSALRDSGQLVVADGIATVTGEDLPGSFVSIINGRLERLSPDARWLLRATSVLGRPFDLEAAGRLMDRRPTGLFDLVDEVNEAGMLVEDQDGLTFRHDQVRLAVQSSLGAVKARQLHREAAAMASELGRPTAEIAAHLLRSGPAGTREAVDLLRDTAARVAPDSPADAAELMQQALNAIGRHDPERPEMVAATVRLLASAAKVARAQELGEAALRAGLDPPTRAYLHLGLAEAFKHAGHNARAAEYAEDGLAGPAATPPTRARLHAIHAHATFYLDDFAAADRAGAAADEIGREHEPGAAVFGLTARSLVAQAQGRLADSLEHASAATELADRSGGTALHRHPRIWLANALTSLDRFDEAQRELRAARREAERLGTRWAQPLLHYYLSALLTARGRLDDAAAEADAGVTVAEQETAHQLIVPLLGTLIRLAVLRRDLDQARAHIERVAALIATGINAPPEDVEWPRAMLFVAEGATGAAVHEAARIYDTLPARPTLIVQRPTAAGALVRMALTAGRRDRAAIVVDSAARLAAGNPDSRAAAGSAAHAAGLFDEDAEQLTFAVKQFRGAGRSLALASALADLAVLTRKRDEHYDEAMELSAEFGAYSIRARLDAGFGTAAGSGIAKTPVLPLLTRVEREVALLVADGLTNTQVADRLWKSPHTVDTHLRKIFKKQDIRSRVELAKLVAEERARNPGDT
ncbi:AAA family ATPase [Actinoplanes sp. NPDC026670]|uniref:helix-turn-helix transcriptional regulator n=1 Tax=Actinoplanes sp. NPDC026670 TaxID=3154700 RepID=UPI0033D056EB